VLYQAKPFSDVRSSPSPVTSWLAFLWLMRKDLQPHERPRTFPLPTRSIGDLERRFSFLKRKSQCRGYENARGERDWDNPGQPGKGKLKLVQRSPPTASNRGTTGICHQLLWAVSQPLSMRLRSCAARRDEKPRPSRVRRVESFDPPAHAVSPGGLGCYCADQHEKACSGETTSPKRP
jgi:hypothetical protein